jgi:hypothetical protein
MTFHPSSPTSSASLPTLNGVTLEAERATALGELENLKLRRTRLEDLQRAKETLLKEYAGMASEDLDGGLTPEKRHQIYRMLRLRVRVPSSNANAIEVEGVLKAAVSTPVDTYLSTPVAIRIRSPKQVAKSALA